MKKPLLRYTIGKVSKAGWDILSESIRVFKIVYPEFDIIVCYNHLNVFEIENLKNLKVELLDQSKFANCYSFIDSDMGKVRNFGWKLVPFRLRVEAHELWMDNDIIIRERIFQIDDWLSKNTGIISSGFEYSYGFFSNDLDLLIQEPFCAGLFGLPPNFDFEKHIKKHANCRPIIGYDEQGLVAKTVSNISNFITIPQNQLSLISEYWKPNAKFWSRKGIHFARANRWENHKGWMIYKKLITP